MSAVAATEFLLVPAAPDVDDVGYGKDPLDTTIYVSLSVVRTEAGRVKRDSIVKIATKGLLGDKMIEITKGVASEPIPPDGEITAADYLESLVETIASDDSDVEGPLEGRKVQWCGEEVTGVLYRFDFLGDPRIYEGFDLPPTREGPRFLVFNDIRKKSDWSETALATFVALDASIACDGGKIPVRDSAD